MQTSDAMKTPDEEKTDAATDDAATPQDARRRWPRRLAWGLFVLAFLVALDIGLTYLLQPLASSAEVVWHEYRENTEPIETLVAGSSVAENALQPTPIDEGLGDHSFCFASPGQSLDTTLTIIRRILDDGQPVRRILLGTSYTALAEVPLPYANMAIMQSMLADQPLAKKITGYLPLVFSPDSIAHLDSLCLLAPWTLEHVAYTPEGIGQNIQDRIQGSPQAALSRTTPELALLGQGYINDRRHLDFTRITEDKLEAFYFRDIGFKGHQLAALEQICALCEERGVELIVFVAPHPDFQQLALGWRYPLGMARAQLVCEAHGVTFLDFSLAKKELLDLGDRDFMDTSHLSTRGSSRFTPVLAETVRRVEAGEDVRGLFFGYNEWDAYLASVDGISAITTSREEDFLGNGLLTAHAWTGSQTKVEYAFAVRTADSDEWVTVRDYDQDPTLSLAALEGQAELRVEARQVGATKPERTHYEPATI